jgi:hypothetical protein
MAKPSEAVIQAVEILRENIKWDYSYYISSGGGPYGNYWKRVSRRSLIPGELLGTHRKHPTVEFEDSVLWKVYKLLATEYDLHNTD